MSGILQSFAYGRAFTSAPVNTVAPVVSGTAQARQTLSCTTGTWTGVPTPTYTYQWQYGVSNTNISGATSSTYVVSSTYVGQTIRCVVTATNSVSAVSANSNSTSTVTANVPTAPTIGTATATGSTTATVTYTASSDNGGATITTYTATSSPGGITGTLSTSGSGTITVSGLTTNTAYTFTVTATNSVGTSAASSASNSVTPVASGFVATMTYTGYSTSLARDVATNSSGLIYVYANGGGVGQNSILQFSTTGTNNWKRYGYTQGPFFSEGVDASNNYYVLGTFNSNNRVQVTKYNSSDVFQWSTWWDETGTTYLAAMTKPVFDSSGNMYFGIQRVVDAGCCTTQNNYVMRKVTSAGAVVNAANIYLVVGSTDYSGPAGVGVDSSGNIYNVAIGYDSGYSTMVIVKSTSAYAFVAGKAYFRTTPSNSSYEPRGYVFDVTNSVGYIVGYGSGTGVITKHDTSLAVSWSYKLTGIINLRACALDSSGNIYAVGNSDNTNPYMRIVKLNSSGTVQWARTISNTRTLETSYMSIAVSGSKFTVCGTYSAPASAYVGFVFEAPTDGSGTGTFTNGGYTWTYASYSESLSSVTLTNQGTASQSTAGPSTSGSVTPTVATATAWNTSSTQF